MLHDQLYLPSVDGDINIARFRRQLTDFIMDAVVEAKEAKASKSRIFIQLLTDTLSSCDPQWLIESTVATFSMEAQEILGRPNLSHTELLSLPMPPLMQLLQWGVYMNIITEPDAASDVYVGSSVSPKGVRDRLTVYEAIISGTRKASKGSLHTGRVIMQGITNSFRTVACTGIARRNITPFLTRFVEGFTMTYLDTFSYPSEQRRKNNALGNLFWNEKALSFSEKHRAENLDRASHRGLNSCLSLTQPLGEPYAIASCVCIICGEKHSI